MACGTRLKPRQTISERAAEVRRAVTALDKAITERRVQIKIGPGGAVAFTGWSEQERDGITDGCALRRILATGSALARAEIAKAEQMSGQRINKLTVAQGVHSHDGGATWHKH